MSVINAGTSWMTDVLLPEAYAGFYGIPRRLRAKGFKTQQEAQVFEERVREAVHLRKPLPDRETQDIPRMWDALDRCIERHYSNMACWKQRVSGVKLLKRVLPNYPITEITELVIDDAVESLRQLGYKPNSINNLLSIIGVALKPYQRYRLIPRMQMGRLPEKLKVLVPLKEHEEILIVEWLQERQPVVADMVSLYLLTGCRKNELRNLKVRDVDTGLHRITVNGKTGQRVIPLVLKAQDLLYPYLAGKGDEARVFNVSESLIQHWFTKAKQGVGIKRNFTLHDLRHTFSTRLTERGVNPFVVQRLMGHASIKTTQRYTHLNVDSLTQGIGALA